MTLVGGLRARFVHDSLFHMIEQALTDLGWFDPARKHAPVTLLTEDVTYQDSVALNTLAVVDAGRSSVEMELGSLLSEQRWQFFIDFFAEDRSLGIHMINDLQDLLEGRMTLIGRGDSEFPVFDYSQPTPVELFRCDIQNVVVDRSHFPRKPWQRFWYSIAMTVVDTYDSDD